MKKHIFFTLLFAALMFAISVCMFMQAAGDGGLIYFGHGSGTGTEPKDIGNALMMIALMIMPLAIAAQIDARKQTHLIRFAPLLSLLVFFLFPIPFEARLWSDAFYPDGKPMYEDDNPQNERVKSWDAFFGYIPLWEAHYEINPPYDRYETTDLGKRYTSEGNQYVGRLQVWGLNRKGWLNVEDDNPGKVYECIFEDTLHILGFYWDDRHGNNLEYRKESELPQDRCRCIDTPQIGSGLTE